MIEEKWKEIKGYNGIYSVSNTGKVKRNIPTCKAQAREIGFNQKKKNLDYTLRCVILSLDKVKEKFSIHRLVAIYFIPNKNKKRNCINHIDGNPLNNCVTNLEWCTNKENTHHAIRTGLHKVTGQDHPNAKLKNIDIINIRQEYSKGNITQTSLGKKYDVTQTNIRSIVTRKLWKHI